MSGMPGMTGTGIAKIPITINMNPTILRAASRIFSPSRGDRRPGGCQFQQPGDPLLGGRMRAEQRDQALRTEWVVNEHVRRRGRSSLHRDFMAQRFNLAQSAG